MDSIDLHERHLKIDIHAMYKDLFINGRFFQDELKNTYPEDFTKGRYREEFMPIILPKPHSFDSQKSLNLTNLLPIYGCQDDCCIYLYANCKYEQHKISWMGIAQDSYYFGSVRTTHHHLHWLPNFKPLHFKRENFEHLYPTKHNF